MLTLYIAEFYLTKSTKSIEISHFTRKPNVFYFQRHQKLRIIHKNGVKREILHVKHELEPQSESKLVYIRIFDTPSRSSNKLTCMFNG